MIEYYIYALICPITGLIRYIGQTRHTLQKRLYGHIRNSKIGKCYRNNWINSLKKKGLKPEIKLIKTCKGKKRADYAENFYIKLYGRADKKEGILTNETDGGQGSTNFRHSEKTKKILSEKSKKYYDNLPEEEKEKRRIRMSEIAKSIVRTEEWKQKISKSHIGIFPTPETRIKLSNSLMGRKSWNKGMKGVVKMTDEAKQKMSDSSTIKVTVYQLDPITEEILNEFPSFKKASQIFKADIISCAYGINPTAGGYKWKRKADTSLEDIQKWENKKTELNGNYQNEFLINKAIHHNRKKIYQTDKNTGDIINEYNSRAEARRLNNISYIDKYSHGYIWIKEKDISKDKLEKWDRENKDRFFTFTEMKNEYDSEKRKEKSTCKKTIYQIDMLSGKILNKFSSVADASKNIGLKSISHIAACARGERETSGGYKWKYKTDIQIKDIEEFEKHTDNNLEKKSYIRIKRTYTEEERKKMSKRSTVKQVIYQLDKNQQEILNEFPSIVEAKKNTGILGISHSANRYKNTGYNAGGYKWRKREDIDINKIKEWEEIKQERLSMIF